ncbi:uncharacterized protein LOC113205907 isoform X1 [Frankliniella occidentalis]|uniref:Uncharacterized protein LOC113205907 isoform X1 n=2 Tax=Frankliniella occidentalis TaxID=133901 RepID=A0A6J1SDT1_FRAOC|nr:uncharacterized protein LOC113205907 isoform X1 [Frankliniella occidentalis]
MPTSASTSPQLAVYAKLLCLLMVVICGVAAPMEEKVRLFNEKTKGFMEAHRKGHFVSARNVTVSKFTNLTIRSTNEIGVVELVFADLSPQRRLCVTKDGKLKGMKKLSSKRRQPGCLFRECVDGMYFFYLTTQHRPRLVGFHGREQFNPLGPPRCCDLTRGEHLVPDASGKYVCGQHRAPHHQSDYFFFLKLRQENATIADAIPAHNHRQGGHNRDRVHGLDDLPRGPRRGAGSDGSDLEDAEEHRTEHPHPRRTHVRQRQPQGTADNTRHHGQQKKQQQQQPQQQRPHRTRHQHHLHELQQLQPLRPPPRPLVRVRHRKVTLPPPQQDMNLLPWD